MWVFKAWEGNVERCSTGRRQRIKSIRKAKDFHVDVKFEEEEEKEGPEQSYQLRMGSEDYARIFSKSCYMKSIVVNDYVIVLSRNIIPNKPNTFHLLAIDRFSFEVIDSFDFDDDKIPITLINVHPHTTIRNKVSSMPYLEEEVQVSNKFIVAFRSLPVALLYSVGRHGIKAERQQGWQYESVKKQHGRQLIIQDFVQIAPKEATFMAVGNFNFVMELKHNQIFYWTYYTNMKCTLPLTITSASLLYWSGSVIASNILGGIYSIKLPRSVSDHEHIESLGNLESSKRQELALSYTKLYANSKDFITTLKTHSTDTILFGDTAGNIHVNIGSKNFTAQVCNCLITSIAVLPQYEAATANTGSVGVLVGASNGGLYLVLFNEAGLKDEEISSCIRAIG